MSNSITSKKLSLIAVLIALGVILSHFLAIPVGPTKIFPGQHMINGLAAVILGPIYAVFIAVVIGVIRNGLGIGSLFAFPGGVPGALVVGIVYYYIKKTDYATLTEPIGTAIGALLSSFILAPAIGKTFPELFGPIFAAQWQIFLILFLASSIPGAILGFLVLKALRRAGIIEKITTTE